MEGQKLPSIANEEWGAHEEAPNLQDSVKEALIARIKTSSFPVVLELGNIAYSLKESKLQNELGTSNSSKITYLKENEKFSGSALITVENLEDALLVAEKLNTEVCGRTLKVRFQRRDYQENRGTRGNRRGDMGGRGERQGFQRRDYPENSEKRGNFRGERRERGEKGERGETQGFQTELGNYEDKKVVEDDRPYEKKYHSRNKLQDSIPTNIVAADSSSDKLQPALVVDKLAVQAKSQPNPFGNAKPVDTLHRELEFEKIVEETKKTQASDFYEEQKVKGKNSKKRDVEENKHSEKKLPSDKAKETGKVAETRKWPIQVEGKEDFIH